MVAIAVPNIYHAQIMVFMAGHGDGCASKHYWFIKVLQRLNFSRTHSTTYLVLCVLVRVCVTGSAYQHKNIIQELNNSKTNIITLSLKSSPSSILFFQYNSGSQLDFGLFKLAKGKGVWCTLNRLPVYLKANTDI